MEGGIAQLLGKSSTIQFHQHKLKKMQRSYADDPFQAFLPVLFFPHLLLQGLVS